MIFRQDTPDEMLIAVAHKVTVWISRMGGKTESNERGIHRVGKVGESIKQCAVKVK